MTAKHIPQIQLIALGWVMPQGFLGAGLALYLRGKLGPFAVPIPAGGPHARDVLRAQL